jgi:hypothetical protein
VTEAGADNLNLGNRNIPNWFLVVTSVPDREQRPDRMVALIW